MNRYSRVLVGVLALVLIVTGSALATRSPKADQQPQVVAASPDSSGDAVEALTQEHLGRLVERLATAGIEADADALAALAATYGVGGAVRLTAWADASGMDTADIAAMFDSGMGWGEIARQLNEEDPEGDLQLHPGIGWIMGGGHGKDKPAGAADGAAMGQGAGRLTAPGQLKKQ